MGVTTPCTGTSVLKDNLTQTLHPLNQRQDDDGSLTRLTPRGESGLQRYTLDRHQKSVDTEINLSVHDVVYYL